MNRLLAGFLALAAAALPLSASAQAYGPYGRHDDRYDDRYARTVRCESDDHRTRVCRVDTRGGVQIVRQHSDAPCVLGRSWGYDRRGIWVARGCRAQFAVGGGHAGRGYDRHDRGRYRDGYGPQVVRCESIDERPRFCRLPPGAHRVDIRRQLSRTRCSEGYNWGRERGGIWVERGCRAEFVVY